MPWTKITSSETILMSIEKIPSLTLAVGKAIRELRGDIPVSQEELAHRADIDRSYMGSIERGATNITVKNLSKVAKALECSPSKILKLAEKYWDGTIAE